MRLQRDSLDNREKLSFTSQLPVPVQELFSWHARVGAFERLNPPWNPVTVTSPHTNGINDGSEIEIAVGPPPLSLRWRIRHSGFQENARFIDTQISGPFSFWEHTHNFSSISESSSQLFDDIRFLAPHPRFLATPFIKSELARVFAYRHEVLRRDLVAHSKWAHTPRLRVLIAGASGLVGTNLAAYLSTAGHSVFTLVRRPPKNGTEIQWDPYAGYLGSKITVDAVVNLSGENIAEGRWNAAKKTRLWESRVKTTSFLVEKILHGEIVTGALLSASAIGIYGNRGDEELTERSVAGKGFFAELGAVWESEAAKLRSATSCRVASLRFGVIISAKGGALRKMLLPFLCGAGGPLGYGNQWFSWIALQDVLGVVEHILHTPTLQGAINVVAPNPVRNKEFTKTLGKVLRRPTVIPVPAPILRLAVGELADEALLSSTKVSPDSLVESGYTFQFDGLESALRFELGR